MTDIESLAELAAATSAPRQEGATVDGAALLSEVEDALRRFVVHANDHYRVANVLWIAATHAQSAWEHATRIAFTSPLKRCGKTRAQNITEALSHGSLATSNISVAALVRSIAANDPPTLHLDEYDAIFGRVRNGKAEAAEDLRGIINAGHERGRPYIRWDAANRKTEECPTFCMVSLAGIGDLPDTIADRSVVIHMRRRAKGEEVSPFRLRRDKPALVDLRDRLHRHIRQHADTLRVCEPVMPVEDRAADTWEPLIAVADLVGGVWPERARLACKVMCAEVGEDDGDTLGERLLCDLRVAFGDEAHVGTTMLIQRLWAMEEAPWKELPGNRVLTAVELARLLKPYGVKPVQIKALNAKGYRRDHLLDPWRRYCDGEG